MSENVIAPPPYEDNQNAPLIYFDIVGANGIMNGAVEIEIAHRVLVPVSGTNDVNLKFVTCGRIRCSPTAAQNLITGLQNSLNMLQQPEQPTAVGKGHLN